MNGATLLIVFKAVLALVGIILVFAMMVGLTKSVRLRTLLGECLMFLLAYLWVVPVGYLAIGAFYWLLDGTWMSINLCYDADLFCGTGKALGLDKILQSLADSPFLVLLGVTAAAYVVLLLLLTDFESEARLDEELEDLRKKGKL
jgi:hypothetical protein